MSTLTYAWNPFDSLLTDGASSIGQAFWLHDLPEDKQELHTRALAASGDYFEMLASELEQIAVTLPLQSMEQYKIQHYIGELLYLQYHYKIIKK
jgi:hypothetical protein